MGSSLRVAKRYGAIAVLIAVALAASSRPGLAQEIPSYPDTSATGSVPAMSQKLVTARSALDRVEAEIASLQKKSTALDNIQAARREEADKVKAEAEGLIKDWNTKVAAFNASCGNRMQMHDPDWTNCFHWETELNDTRGALEQTVSQAKARLQTISQEYNNDLAQQLSYQRSLRDLNNWKSTTSAGIEALDAAIQTKCKPQHNCPTS